MYFFSSAGLISCKDVGFFEAFSCPWTPSPTFYKLLEIERDFKGKVSVVCYAVAIPLAFVNSWLACGLYVLVVVMWLIPDRRIERELTERTA